MKRRFTRALVPLLAVLGCLGAMPAPAAAEHRFIVRAADVHAPLLGSVDGLQLVTAACSQAGCTVRYGLGDNLSRLFLVTTADSVDPNAFVALLPTIFGIEHAEIDALGSILGNGTTTGTTSDGTTSSSDGTTTTTSDGTTSTTSDSTDTTSGGTASASDTTNGIPPALLDQEPVEFFGAMVRGGYVRQPANGILGIDAARQQYGLTGGQVIVAVIDTGIDATHPALRYVVLDGYDFTRNRTGASELSDVDQSTMWAVDEAKPGRVNQSTIAILDQSTIGVLDEDGYSAFGHGTMVAGVIHLVAPQAQILPLKAFRADGTGYTSDVLRAVYSAVGAGAKVLNMSFSFGTFSPELARAINYATRRGAVPVASVGNDGQQKAVYPAALPYVIGVASTSDYDVLSQFSNFGTDVAWIAAPGEAVLSTYPLHTYAAAWGTSFSTPFAAGAAALLAEVDSQLSAAEAADAEGHAVWISPEVSRGRLDIPAAVQAWRGTLGLP